MTTKLGRGRARFLNPNENLADESQSDHILGLNGALQAQTRLKVPAEYLLCEPLCVLQALCEGLNENVAAALAQAIVVSTLLTSLGQQSHPNLGYCVAAGLLPECTE